MLTPLQEYIDDCFVALDVCKLVSVVAHKLVSHVRIMFGENYSFFFVWFSVL
jgi:hypothetical protein